MTEDIRDLMQVTSGAPVATEAPIENAQSETDVTVAEVGKEKGQVEGEVPTLAKEAEAKEEELATPESESKSKEERKIEGSKIEQKIGRLTKVSADRLARAERAEQEAQELRKQIELLKSNKDKGLDSLGFDERVAKVARDSIEEKYLAEKEQTLNSEIQSIQKEEWTSKLDEASQRNEDFDSVIKSAKDIFLPDMIIDAIKNSHVGGDLLYEICKDTSIAENLARIKNPLNASTILFKLEQSIENRLGASESQTQQAPIVASTPKLTPTPTNNGRSPIHPVQLDMESYINMRRSNGTLR